MRREAIAILTALILALGTACGNDDAGTPDAATADSAMPDAALPDGMAPDAAQPDAALPDAALPDAALPDAALEQDINLTDGANDLLDGVGVYDFGQANVGGAAIAHTFVIENTGGTDLTLTSVTLTSGDVGDFSVDAAAMATTVPASGSTTFDLAFAPQSAGARSVEVTVVSDDPDETTYTFTAQGSGASLPANTWTNLNPTGLPPVRFNHSLVHVGGDTLILFGGMDDTYTARNETWEFDVASNTWALLSPSGSPGARDAQAMVHVGGGKVILFGGKDATVSPLNDTWEYDVPANAWTQLTPAGAPSARYKHDLVHTGGNLVLLFGGQDGGMSGLGDTWQYDVAANTWSQVTTTGAPLGRHAHRMTYVGNDKVIMYGGHHYVTGDTLDDTWEYDVPAATWTQVSPAASPGIRMNHGLAYLGNDLVLLFAGKGIYWQGPIGGTWVYDVAAQTWTDLAPASPPANVFSFGMAELGNGSAILFAGALAATGTILSTDTWRYDY